MVKEVIIDGIKYVPEIPLHPLTKDKEVDTGKGRKQSPYNDKNGNPIFEGDMVKGLGKHIGQSEVFFEYEKWQPFDYLNDYDGNNYEIVSPEKSDTGKDSKVLFTTEDGVDITDENEKHYCVYPKDCQLEIKHWTWKILPNSEWLRFHKKENAVNWLIENKPCLTLEECKEVMGSYKLWNPIQKLLEIATQKLKQHTP